MDNVVLDAHRSSGDIYRTGNISRHVPRKQILRTLNFYNDLLIFFKRHNKMSYFCRKLLHDENG